MATTPYKSLEGFTYKSVNDRFFFLDKRLKTVESGVDGEGGLPTFQTVTFNGNGTTQNFYLRDADSENLIEFENILNRGSLKINSPLDFSSMWLTSDELVLQNSEGFSSTIRTDNLDADYVIQAPKANGVPVMMIDGLPPDDEGKAFTSGGITDKFITSHNKFIRIAAGVIRPAAGAPSTPITWSFINDAQHTLLFFESVSGSGNTILVNYPPIKKVISFVAVPDEALTASTVQVGVSVGTTAAVLYAYRLTMNAGRLTGNGSTAWVNLGLTFSVLSYNSTTGLTSFTPSISGGTVLGANNEIEGAQISYVGTNNYHIRRQYSGLGGIAGFYLVDNATNAIVTGNLSTTDYVSIMIARPTVTPIPAETVAVNGYPADIYTANSNYWLHAVFESYIFSKPLSATSILLEWQVFNIGGTFATNYRVTRALNSSPGSETTIYNGAGFNFTDTGLVTNTIYYYRLYVTMSAVESLLTYERVSTL